MKLLSVIIPSYHCERFIGDAIRSVFEQSYRPIELIIVDDGSTDGSREAIGRVCRTVPIHRLVIEEQPNQGAHAAIMRGLELAGGDLLSILNCDDFYHSERFQELVPRLGNGRSLVFSGLRFVDVQGRALPSFHAWPRWYETALRETADCLTTGYALLLHNVSVTSGNFLFTRDLYERLGGFSRHRFVHDWDFLLRSIYYSEPLFDPRALMSYRIHDGNTTESVRHLLFEEASDAWRRYVAMCGAGPPPNTLAPCAEHWPRVFPEFVARQSPFFAPGMPLGSLIHTG